MIPVVLATVALAAPTPVCPAGPTWVRERQQRPPVTEPAPLATLTVACGTERILPRAAGWSLPNRGDCVATCGYADGSTAQVPVTARRISRAGVAR